MLLVLQQLLLQMAGPIQEVILPFAALIVADFCLRTPTYDSLTNFALSLTSQLLALQGLKSNVVTHAAIPFAVNFFITSLRAIVLISELIGIDFISQLAQTRQVFDFDRDT